MCIPVYHEAAIDNQRMSGYLGKMTHYLQKISAKRCVCENINERTYLISIQNGFYEFTHASFLVITSGITMLRVGITGMVAKMRVADTG